MARSQQTFHKREREKQKMQNRQDKAEKMQERKANAQKGKSLNDMLAYVDENGDLSASPPDPKMKKILKPEEGKQGTPKQEESEDQSRNRTGNSFR